MAKEKLEKVEKEEEKQEEKQTEQTDILSLIQSELKAPKGQQNKFGGYRYRSCEDILEALKPILAKHNATITLSDEIFLIGENTNFPRFYVKATATFTAGDYTRSVTAYAREEENKKGMDASQITGAASSYARKYALNGLFAIDDTKDADATNTHGKDEKPVTYTKDKPQAPKPQAPQLTLYETAYKAIMAASTEEVLTKLEEQVKNSTKLRTNEKAKLAEKSAEKLFSLQGGEGKEEIIQTEDDAA